MGDNKEKSGFEEQEIILIVLAVIAVALEGVSRVWLRKSYEDVIMLILLAGVVG
jgi:hypothetical protein